jgi:hypothetical protein
MLTTLSLDDDELAAAWISSRQKQASPAGLSTRNGLPLLPVQPGGLPVDLELVNQLRDEAP